MERFWDFLKEDSWKSFVVSLVLAFVVIKFVFFPVLSLLTGTSLPLVIVESCSMYHSSNLESVLENSVYDNYDISFNDTSSWGFKHGLNKGDIVFILGTSQEKLDVGDVIVFDVNNGLVSMHPIIHRVIESNGKGVTTKGDNNPGLLNKGLEQNIKNGQIMGRAVFRIPYLGWVKLMFFENSRPVNDKGFC